METEADLDKAKAANDAKSQFLANMSHEVGQCRLIHSRPRNNRAWLERLKRQYDAPRSTFAFRFNLRRYNEMRTPLNGIIGVNQLLLETPLDAEQQELAEIINTSADSLLSVINDILDLSRVVGR
jgi:signal transduction histidine kinase